jgi:hypothetical protein
MITEENVLEISYDFVSEIIELTLKNPIIINNALRKVIKKKGTFADYKESCKKYIKYSQFKQ